MLGVVDVSWKSVEGEDLKVKVECEKQRGERREEKREEAVTSYTYDEAVDLTGHGRYSHILLVTCSIISNAVALDMFGFSVVVTAASCDLNLGLAQTGMLASAPFAGYATRMTPLVQQTLIDYGDRLPSSRTKRFASTFIMRTAEEWNSLPADAFPEKYDLDLFKARVNRHFLGLLFAFIWGYYADTRGRKKALVLSSAVGFILAAFSSFSSSWQMMLAFKLMGCSFSTAAYTLTMTYLGESIVSRRRSQYIFIMNSVNLASEAVSFIMAYFLLPLRFNIPIPWLSITYRPWRLLTLLMAVPLGLGALMMLFLHESPKFLANMGQEKKALEVLKKIYQTNGGKIEDYPVKTLSLYQKQKEEDECKYCSSFSRQTVPIFQRPLLWRTLQLFYLLIICCSTNNVFVMWFPTMVNSFFSSFHSPSTSGDSFCQRVISNITAVANDNDGLTCNDEITNSTIYSGILYGLFFLLLNLVITRFVAWRRVVLVTMFTVAALSGILVDMLRIPIASMIAFTLLQGTSIGIGIVGSYFVDIYPTSYRGQVTSLGMMVARFVSFAGVNLIGAVIVEYCSLTFYTWALFVLSGVVVTLFLPKDKEMRKNNPVKT